MLIRCGNAAGSVKKVSLDDFTKSGFVGNSFIVFVLLNFLGIVPTHRSFTEVNFNCILMEKLPLINSVKIT